MLTLSSFLQVFQTSLGQKLSALVLHHQWSMLQLLLTETSNSAPVQGRSSPNLSLSLARFSEWVDVCVCSRVEEGVKRDECEGVCVCVLLSACVNRAAEHSC